jgi:dTDP-4-amino-4,6-dideoxygalactose transaminase
MIRRVRCGELGRSPVELLADWLAGRQIASCSHEDDRTIILTRSGREAIALATRLWKIAPGDDVLVPAYNCGSEISPVIGTGARAVMYRVDRNAEIDVDDIRRRLGERVKVLLVTHYFGRPADLRALAPLCRDAGVKLLEDCAHTPFGAGLGGIGDAAVFSLRKTLPASDGGVLAIRSSGLEEAGEKELCVEPPPILATRGTLSLIKKWVQRRLWIGKGFALLDAGVAEGSSDEGEAALPEVPETYYLAPGAPLVGASRIARGLLNTIDMSEVVERRRRNYSILADSLKGVRGFCPLWGWKPLEPDICPLGLPGLVDVKRRWHRGLNRAGISVSPWWAGFHRGLDWDAFPEARTLKQRLILLPVHQGLTAADMQYIGAVARRIE